MARRLSTKLEYIEYQFTNMAITERAREIARIGQDAFWSSVAAECPEIETGDFPPECAVLLDEVLAESVQTWMDINNLKLQFGEPRAEQWFKVERTDGNVQYATKTDGGYCLWGSGFIIREFANLKELTPVDEPPTELKQGYVHFEGKHYCRAIIDRNSWWNGWAMPWIHHEDVDDLMNALNNGGIAGKLEWDGDNIKVWEDHGEDELVYAYDIHPTDEFGENYYYFGGEGLCFEFSKTKENE